MSTLREDGVLSIEVVVGDVRHPCDFPAHSGEQAVICRGLACSCGYGSDPAEPLRVYSRDKNVGHSEVTGAARCLRCREVVGTLVVTVSTLFGLEEDQRVLHGGWRVY